MREIVDFVEGLGRGVAVIENGDCLGFEDAKRVREITGAHSVMIATAAEANPSCFSPRPLVDVEQTLVPSYLRISKYLGNHWSNTKFCALQFRGSHVTSNRSAEKSFKDKLAKCKSFDDVDDIVGDWTGEADFAEIVQAIEARPSRNMDDGTSTPNDWRPNPQIQKNLQAPLLPANERRLYIPAAVSGHDELTPSPMPRDTS